MMPLPQIQSDYRGLSKCLVSQKKASEKVLLGLQMNGQHRIQSKAGETHHVLLMLWGLTLVWGGGGEELNCSFITEWMESWFRRACSWLPVED